MAASLSSSNPQFLNNDNPAPRPSLSESALPSRRIILRTNNRSTSTNSSMTTSSMGIRPSRFVKPTPSSSNSLTTSINNNDMESFVSLFEEYSQKVYMEGYLMHQDKKYFVELCGTTLAFWDIDRPGTVVTPDYIPIMVDTKAYATLRQQFTLELLHKKKVMVFDTLDPASLTKWICAVHLACFERQLLNQYFTLHLFSFSGVDKSITTASSSSGYLQVLLPNNKNEWKKLWVVVTGTNSNNDSKKSKNMGTHDPHLTLLESKKSKTPLLELKRVDHAYAVYPESASLIPQSTLVRLEGVQQDNQPVDILLMADSNNHMTRWLSSLYNAFKLYGRPQAMVQDPMNPVALNFGEILPGNVNETAPTQHWWLETDDVIQDVDVFASKDKTEIHQRLINTIQQKQSSPSPLRQQPSTLQQQQHPYSQQRANSLPLITVESMDPPRQRATSDAGILNDSAIRPALHSQVADSSDESDGDLGEDDEDDEEEADSDDEPIGKSKPKTSQQSSSKKAVSSLLIPDFDFGNGFDTDRRRRESTAGSMLLSGGSSPTNSDIISRPSSRHHHRQEQSVSTQKSKNSGGSSTTSSSGNSDKVNKKSAPAPGSASSLFGDFSLTTDFNKYLDPATSRTSTQDRKYSLPANVKLYNGDNTSTPTSNSIGLDRRSSSWDDYRMGWDDQVPRGNGGRRYMNEDCIYQDGDDENDGEKTGDDDTDDLDYEQDGPLIPSLNDHFAPRNSLLDSHAGEQLSAKEQIEYARATGQPLIQMPSKPRLPKGGLVGVISQREKSRRQGKGTRVAERVNQHHADLFEREKERRILEQRQQQYMKHQIMMYAQNGYVHPMMMHPYMTPPTPGNVLGSPTMGSPGSPYSNNGPMSSSNGHFYGRPYSPSGNSYFGSGASTMYPSSPSSPHQPFINIGSSNSGSGSSGGGSVGRRNSRPLLPEEEEDEPLCSPLMAYQLQQQQQQQQQQQYHQYPRTASPSFHHKMQPVPSSSTGSSSLLL